MDEASEKAKRALLGLCDYEMDNGVLTKISAGRNGDVIIPKGCKKIMKDSIYLSNPDCTIKFSDNVKDCKANIFIIPMNSFRVGEHNLTVDLGNMGHKAVYGVGRSLQRLNTWVEVLKVTYIFSEEKFAEQAVGFFVGGCIHKRCCCLHVYKDKILAGETDISDKIFNPTILAEILNVLEKEFKFMENYTKSFFGAIAKRIGVQV